MMKKLVLIFLTIFILKKSSFVIAQINLVPNFSFEQNDTCPNTEDQIQYALGWAKYSCNSPYISTPDYYNICSPDTLMGIPKSSTGFQNAHRNCTAYAGLVSYSIPGWPNYREHIGIQLSSPLTIGQKYFLSFYTVMGGDILQGGYYYCMPSDKMGMRLSTVAYNPSNPAPIDNFAHLYVSTVLNDTLN